MPSIAKAMEKMEKKSLAGFSFQREFGANCLLVQQRLLPSTLDMQQLLTKVFRFSKREKVQPFAELGCSKLIFVEIAKNISGDKGTIIAAFYGCSRSLQLQAMQHCPLNGPRSTNGQNTVLNMRTGRTAAARNSKWLKIPAQCTTTQCTTAQCTVHKPSMDHFLKPSKNIFNRTLKHCNDKTHKQQCYDI